MSQFITSISSFFNQHSIKGFLDEQEGVALAEMAYALADKGPCLEIGSYCGKSSVYLGMAIREHASTLYSVDHHRGSEEHQVGEGYHDSELFDSELGVFDSFPTFRHTLKIANLEDTVVPIVTSSETAVKDWRTPLSFVFIDGGHSPEQAMRDCTTWSKHVLPGGILAIHDIFEKPEEGGQGPYLAMQALLEQGRFVYEKKVLSLVCLRKLEANK